MIDDKLRILAAMKSLWREQLTTVFVRQGHYALDPREIAAWPAADVTVASIAALAGERLPMLAPVTGSG